MHSQPQPERPGCMHLAGADHGAALLCCRFLAVRIECDNAPVASSQTLRVQIDTANALAQSFSAGTAAIDTFATTAAARAAPTAGRQRYISPELVPNPPRTAYFLEV
jgi:hypothetical protein